MLRHSRMEEAFDHGINVRLMAFLMSSGFNPLITVIS